MAGDADRAEGHRAWNDDVERPHQVVRRQSLSPAFQRNLALISGRGLREDRRMRRGGQSR